MDTNILKNIINNSTIPTSVESSNEWQSVKGQEEFPAIRNILIDNLSKSFTRLLSYKVSKEAYQRYSVRLNIIETLRDWSRVKGYMQNLSVFQDSEQAHHFLIQLLKKYLTQDVINSCDDIDDLTQLGEILLNLVTTNRSLIKYFSKVVERIVTLDQNEKSLKFLQHIIHKSNDLKLASSFVEEIYINQKSYFIEKPLTDCFIEYCSNQSNHVQFDKMNDLFEKMVDSPSLFLLIMKQLKEFFVTTKYAEVTQNFIQHILSKLQTYCNKYHKDTLDLYPGNLQSCVILLRIKPSHHTDKSKVHTVQLLKKIFLKDCEDALILISHFPEWLPEYLEFFENIEGFTQTSGLPPSVDDEVIIN